MNLVPNEAVADSQFDAVCSAQSGRKKLEAFVIEEAADNDTGRFKFNLRQCIEERRFAIAHAAIALFSASDGRMHQSLAVMTGRSHVRPAIPDAR